MIKSPGDEMSLRISCREMTINFGITFRIIACDIIDNFITERQSRYYAIEAETRGMF